MPKVFLLSANIMTDPYPVYPLGMAIVASALTSAGHQVRQFDFMIRRYLPHRTATGHRGFQSGLYRGFHAQYRHGGLLHC